MLTFGEIKVTFSQKKGDMEVVPLTDETKSLKLILFLNFEHQLRPNGLHDSKSD